MSEQERWDVNYEEFERTIKEPAWSEMGDYRWGDLTEKQTEEWWVAA